MAVPPLLIWAALVAASAAANRQGQKRVESAQNKAYNFAQIQREKREKEAQIAAGKTEEAYRNQPAKMAAEGDALGAAFKGEQENIEQSLAPSNIRPGQSTDAVIGEEARQRAGTRRYTNKLADALGQMRGVDQSLLTAGLAAGNNQTDINMANQFVRGDQNVLAAKLAAAPAKGKNWATLGDVLSLAAMAYGGYAFGAPAAGAKTAAAGTTAANASGGVGAQVGGYGSRAVAPAKMLPMF